MNKKYNIAVIGATGSVGREVLKSLAERNFPINNITAYASASSLGKEVSCGNKLLKIHTLEDANFKDIEIAFFCTNNKISQKYIPKFIKEGVICIDKSSHYRLAPEVALIIPEININDYKKYENKNIIASPNCCVIPLAMVLKPLNDKVKIRRIVVSTYQSASGAGKEAMDELYRQTKSKFSFSNMESKIFPKQIAFNIFPQIGNFTDNNETEEEVKIVNEIKKILDDKIEISITCVRVPVFIGHSISANIEFDKKLTAKQAEDILKKQSFLDVDLNNYLTPVEIVGTDVTHVSRIRNDKSQKNTINLWIVCDNLRKGAALNAIHIAEDLIKISIKRNKELKN